MYNDDTYQPELVISACLMYLLSLTKRILLYLSMGRISDPLPVLFDDLYSLKLHFMILKTSIASGIY